MSLSAYSPTTWFNKPAITTPANASRMNKIEQGIKAVTDAVIAGTSLASLVSVAGSTVKLLKARVTGDAQDRLQVTSDGRIVGVADATIDPATLTSGQWVLHQGATTSQDGLVIIGSSSGTPGNLLLLRDKNLAPIVGAGAAGGWKVFGDHLGVYNGGDIFNPWWDAGPDGTMRVNKGDPAGGVGVIALGNCTTIPTANPDGTHTVNGQTTIGGTVEWTIGNRKYVRGADGWQARVGNVESVLVVKAGTLATGNIPQRIPLPVNMSVESVAATVNTAPTGAALILDVLYGSAYTGGALSIYTTTANRPTIAVSTNGATAAVPDFPACAAPGYLIVNVAQIGSTVAGADLTVLIRLRQTS